MTHPSALFDLSGKTAIVTGGTRGIGEMIATGYLRAGAKVYITSRKADACEAIQSKLSEYGQCIAYPSDLSTLDGVEAFTDWFSAQEQSLDILVNNAGAAWAEPLEEFSEAGWDRIMDLNVKALFFTTQKLLSYLKSAASDTGRARIINIGSMEGFVLATAPHSMVYPASKAAVHHLTRTLAGELAGLGITVNAISPGPFESKMTSFILGTDEGKSAIASGIPLGRIGNANDMIGLSVFLASAASDYMTGVSIPLDGGYVNLR